MSSLSTTTKYDLWQLLIEQNTFPWTFDYALQDYNNDFLRWWLRTLGHGGDALRVKADQKVGYLGF